MKKLNQQGIAHHLLIIFLAVVIVAAVGFAGYKVLNNKKGTEAKAYSWTTVNEGTTPPYAKIQACKFSRTYFSRTVWSIRTKYYNKRGVVQTMIAANINGFGWVEMTGAVQPNTWSRVYTFNGYSTTVPTVNSC